VNARGTFFTAQKALPLLRDGGSIILNTSIANVMGYPGASVYSASKAAVRSFARTWTNELKDRKIRVNAVSPGAIGDTGSFEHIPAEMKTFIIGQIPEGRLGLSKEIATTVPVAWFWERAPRSVPDSVLVPRQRFYRLDCRTLRRVGDTR